jgi:hypothetical protein
VNVRVEMQQKEVVQDACDRTKDNRVARMLCWVVRQETVTVEDGSQTWRCCLYIVVMPQCALVAGLGINARAADGSV